MEQAESADEVQPVQESAQLSAADIFRNLQVKVNPDASPNDVPQAPAGSNYRRVTPEEFNELSAHPAAGNIVRELHAEIFDIRKRVSE